MISIFIDSRLDKFRREIKFSFDFIFQTLGLNHRYISSTNQLKPNDIIFIYGFTELTLDELRTIAEKFISIYVQADVSLYDYRNLTPDKLRRCLREVKLISLIPIISERKFENLAENIIEQEFFAGKINFDIIGNIFFHIANIEEKIDNRRDANNIFSDSNSAFIKWKDTPFIDNLLWLIDNMLKEHLYKTKIFVTQKQYYPRNQNLAILITHSIDDLQKWSTSKIFSSIVDDIIMFFTLKWHNLIRELVSKIKYLFTNYEMYWNFQEFIKIEREYRLRSTFFIASEQSASINYSLDDPDLQDEIHNILREGDEIGLLTTDDKLNREDYAAHKQILLRQTSKEQLGVRQYKYYSHDKNRELIQKITPSYNCSWAFQESEGFKGGLTTPFFGWENSMQSSYLNIPVIFRDVYLLAGKHRWININDAKHILKKLLTSVRRAKGIFCFDFPIASYTELYYCDKLYPYLLALLKAEKAWITTCSEMTSWWLKRRNITIEESENQVSIFFPDDLDNFTLQFHGSIKIDSITGVTARIEGNLVNFINVKADSFAVIQLRALEAESVS